MKRITLLFLLLFGTVTSYSQESHRCATDEFTQELMDKDPEVSKKLQQAESYFRNLDYSKTEQKTQGVVYKVPVVFHVVYSDRHDNISRLQIENGLELLNADFRRMNADASNTRPIFAGVAADVEIEFVLAKKDPNGNCTEGITRTQSNVTINTRDQIKSVINWDNNKYMNVWVVNSISSSSTTNGVVLGYAYLPQFGSQSFVQDGVVIRHDQIGIIGSSNNSSAPNSNNHGGRTFTHEVGHYLGLRHTFQGGCNINGDGITDTPPVFEANDGCDPTINTCSNDNPNLPDQIENYMDYSDGSCQNMFTSQQTTRMRSSLENTSLRQNLRSANNLTSTGITNPPSCPNPVAIAFQDKRIICPGETINFFDSSEDGDPTAYAWSFPGGTPSSSTLKNPSIVYNTPGTFDVQLVINTGGGTDNIVYPRNVSVKAAGSATFYPTWTEDFENITVPSPEISILDNGDGKTFELFTQAGSSGTQSLKMDNFNVDLEGESDEVVSPAISTIFTKDLDLTFDYSFAAMDNSNIDVLNVYASTDCGETWVIRRFYRGSQLRTVSNSTQAFTPSGAADWDTKSISFDAYIGPNPLLVKFEFIGGGGNNFYLDNIRFTGSIGQEEFQSKSIQLYPNPAKNSLTISSNNGFEISNAKLSFKDISGREIFGLENNNGQSDWNIDLSQHNLAPGVYLISIENKKNQKAFKKLVIE